MYSDTKTWKLNREKIEQQIRFLRAQLVTLKDIRRHLREKRPHRKHAHPGEGLFGSSEEEEGGGADGGEEDDDIVTGKGHGVDHDSVDELKPPVSLCYFDLGHKILIILDYAHTTSCSLVESYVLMMDDIQPHRLGYIR